MGLAAALQAAAPKSSARAIVAPEVAAAPKAAAAATKPLALLVNGHEREPREGFKAGERVKYYSATHAKWVGARVQRVNRGPAGTIVSYDLSAKSQADTARVRHEDTPQDAPPPLPALEIIGFSAAPKAVLPTASTAGASTSEPSSKNGAAADRARTTPVDEFKVGEEVEYWSSSGSRWMSAKVLRLNKDEGSCDLDVKPGVLPDRLRKAQVPAIPAASSAAPPPPLSCGFKVGSQVQYWSESKNRWLEAVVKGLREKDGAPVYDLNCKKGTPADRVRPSLVASERYQVGDEIEYWSHSNGRWMPAKVLRLYGRQCDLDIKQGAPLGRLRRTIGAAPTNECVPAKRSPGPAAVAGEEARGCVEDAASKRPKVVDARADRDASSDKRSRSRSRSVENGFVNDKAAEEADARQGDTEDEAPARKKRRRRGSREGSGDTKRRRGGAQDGRDGRDDSATSDSHRHSCKSNQDELEAEAAGEASGGSPAEAEAAHRHEERSAPVLFKQPTSPQIRPQLPEPLAVVDLNICGAGVHGGEGVLGKSCASGAPGGKSCGNGALGAEGQLAVAWLSKDAADGRNGVHSGDGGFEKNCENGLLAGRSCSNGALDAEGQLTAWLLSKDEAVGRNGGPHAAAGTLGMKLKTLPMVTAGLLAPLPPLQLLPALKEGAATSRAYVWSY